MGFKGLFLFLITTISISNAYGLELRWTADTEGLGEAKQKPDLQSILNQINLRSQTDPALAAISPRQWKTSDFILSENRPLAFSQFYHWQQVNDGITVDKKGVRLWTTPESSLIQMEAFLDENPLAETESWAERIWQKQVKPLSISSAWILSKEYITEYPTLEPRDLESSVTIVQKQKAHKIRVIGFHGQLILFLSTRDNSLITKEYQPFATQENSHAYHKDIDVEVFPYFEEHEGEPLTRIPGKLRYISKKMKKSSEDPYRSLQKQKWPLKLNDAKKAATPEGQAEGYWSWDILRKLASAIENDIPEISNDYQSGLLLHGKYGTINIHPKAFEKITTSEIPKEFGGRMGYIWEKDPETEDYAIIPQGIRLGKPLFSPEEAAQRQPIRDPEHDPQIYINEGFDEVQVYYAINQMFESLKPMGFIDPDIADRPFHAYLYDPSINMQDNAYYTNDTINFTTYTAKAKNYARDNLTIWHELGHGIMDRMMGDKLRLADTGGLSEGMADFLAELILQRLSYNKTFPGRDAMRIINKVGFHLTNESHDDGEAYGGAMKDLLDSAKQAYGPDGVHKVTDLTLEAMRLSRNHPALTAEDWLERMLYADRLGRSGLREPRELNRMIKDAFQTRNFGSDPATFSLKWLKEVNAKVSVIEVTSKSEGSRSNKINVNHEEEKLWKLQVQVQDKKSYSFNYPVEVKVFFNTGPLQGALDWKGEDNEPLDFVLNKSGDVVDIPVSIGDKCDRYNEPGKVCSDYVYVQIFNQGTDMPVGKKRFYLRLDEEKNAKQNNISFN